jgi:hypothetical protein
MNTRDTPLGVKVAGVSADAGISLPLLAGTDSLRYQGGYHSDYNVFRSLQQFPGSKQSKHTALLKADRR